MREELHEFIAWLTANDAQGYIGEFGWPAGDRDDQAQWDRLAAAWLRDADAAGLWATAWATGEWWSPDYPLAVYSARHSGGSVEHRNAQATLIEAHLSTPSYRRGINVAGGAFSAPSIAPTSAFSNRDPGYYERDYHYDSQATFDYLAGRGLDLVRIEFRWERVQPVLGRPLDAAELARLEAVVGRAGAAGLAVVLDVHNYGTYYLSDGAQGVRRPIGSDQVTVAHFADLWRRLSTAFHDNRHVAAYGLMNEPVHLGEDRQDNPGPSPTPSEAREARTWEQASQAALTAIRSVGDTKLIMVPGYNWSGVHRWAATHPRGWIDDPADNYRFEAHHYWDSNHDSTYPKRYADEVTGASTAERPTTTLQGWDTPDQTWKADNRGPEVLAIDHGVKRSGTGALKVTATLPAGYGQLRVHDNPTGSRPMRDLTGGGTLLSAWVYLPPATPGTEWESSLFVYDQDWRQWSPGPGVRLLPGQWTRITCGFSPQMLRSVRAVGLQVGTVGGNVPVTIYIDDVTQRP